MEEGKADTYHYATVTKRFRAEPSKASAAAPRPRKKGRLLRTENIFVCWCCVGSDRVTGVGVSLGILDLVRVDGRPCLGCVLFVRCGQIQVKRPFGASTPHGRRQTRPLSTVAPTKVTQGVGHPPTAV